MARSRSTPKSATANVDHRTTAGLMPIRQIDGSVIERTDGRYAVMVQVQGILFDLLSDEEKDQILSRYQEALHMLNEPFQIVVQSTRVHLDAEVDRFRQVQAQYPGDPLPGFAQDIARVLEESMADIIQPLYLFVATGATRAQAQREAETLMHALRSVHPDLHPTLPDAEQTLSLLAQCVGVDAPSAWDRYWPPWTVTPQTTGASSSSPGGVAS